jgi:hypothetical protein
MQDRQPWPVFLPAGIRLSDHISLGVIAGAVPLARVRKILTETGRASAICRRR